MLPADTAFCLGRIEACHIVHPVDTGEWKDEDLWPETQEEMVEAMVALERAMASEIEGLP